MVSNFVNLHIHSEYSALDGFIRIPQLIEKCKQFKMDAVGISDHGTLAGILEFYHVCKNNNIKPIIGCELYFVPDLKVKSSKNFHLNVYAKDFQGYKNLLKITYEGYKVGSVKVYERVIPRVDWSILERNKEGLIVTSSCRVGYVSYLLVNGKEKEALESAERFRSIFGEFYLEVMPPIDNDQVILNNLLLQFANKNNFPLICSTDSHYLEPDDRDAHHLLLAIQSKTTIYDSKRLVFESSPFLSEEQMLRYFSQDIINQTRQIEQMCEFPSYLEVSKYQKPMFNLKNEKDYEQFIQWRQNNGTDDEEYDYLHYKCMKGFEQKQLNKRENAQVYLDRMNYELTMIKKIDIVRYMLVVQDYVNWAKSQGIFVGNGRGSAAGCLCCWLLNITNVDPIKYDLLFERFINLGRSESNLADIDVDFERDRRDEVKQYLINKYGSDCVAEISTHSRMKVRACVQDVVRALNLQGNKSYVLANKITKTIPDDPDITFKEAYETSVEFKEYMDKYPEVKKYVIKLEGIIRQSGVHAAGLIISTVPLIDSIPLIKHNDVIATAYDGETLSAAGYLKVDLLGLALLSVIKDTIINISKLGYKFDGFWLKGLPLTKDFKERVKNEKNEFVLKATKAYALLRNGYTDGIFQLESDGMKKLLYDIRVNSIEDISAVLALYRPGPLQAGLTNSYALRKFGKEEIQYLHPKLEPILKDTYSICCYQEQLMRIAHDLANYTLIEADDLRRAVGKKKPELMQANREKFINGCISNNIQKEVAEQIWDQIEKFAGYGFNKCLLYDEELIDTTGKIYKIGELVGKDYTKIKFFSVDENLNIIENQVVDVFYVNDFEVLEVEFSYGVKVCATQDHKFLCLDGKMYTLKEIIDNNYKCIFLKDFKGKVTVDVKRVTSLGIQRVYSVEMKEPYHNYILRNGLISANSHSISYALNAFCSAYLKANYPSAFWAALLSNEDVLEKRIKYINKAKQMNIKFLPIDINESELKYKVVSDTEIRRDFLTLKGVGKEAIKEIVEVRNNKEGKRFVDFIDFILSVTKRKVNSRVVSALIKVGAFDSFGYNRRTLYENLSALYETVKKYYAAIEKRSDIKFQFYFVPFDDWDLNTKLKYEEEICGEPISGHYFDLYKDDEDDDKLTSLDNIFTDKKVGNEIRSAKVHNQKIKVMVMIKKAMPKTKDFIRNFIVADRYGEIEMGVLEKLYNKAIFKEGNIIKAIVRVDMRPNFEQFRKIQFEKLVKLVKG